jgi:hypothetical protein
VVRGNLVLLPPAHDHLPSSVSDTELVLRLFEARPVVEGDPPVIPVPSNGDPVRVVVGRYGEDWPFLVSGFQGPARADGTPCRWTGRRALLRLPGWTRTVELTLGGYRPPGARPATLALRWTDQRDVRTVILPGEGFSRLSLSRPGDWADPGESPVLELVSSYFRPDRWFTDEDPAPRGVQLAEIALWPDATTPLDQAEGFPFDSASDQ